MAIKNWLDEMRARLAREAYIDANDIPDEDEGPYCARLTMAEERGPDGLEVRERDIVRGRVDIVYAIRCPCGRRWFSPKFESVHVCPKCSRAVLIQPPRSTRSIAVAAATNP
jgi:hypothetical protein